MTNNSIKKYSKLVALLLIAAGSVGIATTAVAAANWNEFVSYTNTTGGSCIRVYKVQSGANYVAGQGITKQATASATGAASKLNFTIAPVAGIYNFSLWKNSSCSGGAFRSVSIYYNRTGVTYQLQN